MQVVGQADVHRLHLRALHHLGEVGCRRPRAVLPDSGLGPLHVTVAGHFQPRLAGALQPLPAVEMRMGYAAAANHGYAKRTVRCHR